MKRLLSFLSMAFLCGSTVADIVPVNACTGGGPIPLQSFSDPPKVHVLETVGNVRELTMHENNEEVIYRNDNDELHSINITSGDATYYTQLAAPMARLAHPFERYVIPKALPKFYSLRSQNWFNFKHLPNEGLEHLYWHNRYLYSYSRTVAPNGYDQFRIYRSNPDKLIPSATRTCLLQFGGGTQMQIAKGHHYPYFFLYASSQTGPVSMLNIYRIDVESCHTHPITPFNEPIEGQINKVYVYEQPGTYILDLSHPNKNLLWKKGEKCNYFRTGHGGPLPLSFKEPIMANWDPASGMELLYFDEISKVKVYKGLLLHPVDEKQMWLTEDFKNLMVAPRASRQYANKLLHLEIPAIVRAQ